MSKVIKKNKKYVDSSDLLLVRYRKKYKILKRIQKYVDVEIKIGKIQKYVDSKSR